MAKKPDVDALQDAVRLQQNGIPPVDARGLSRKFTAEALQAMQSDEDVSAGPDEEQDTVIPLEGPGEGYITISLTRPMSWCGPGPTTFAKRTVRSGRTW